MAGDWRAIQAAYSEDAAYDWVTPESADGGPGLFSEPNARFPVIFPYSDWDGDGTITNLDALTSNEMMQYVNGRTELGDCVVDEGDRVICDQPSARGIFWTDGNELYSGTWTYTIEDGVIAHVAFEIVRGSSGLARARAAEFEMWLDDNRPELGDTLFIPFTDRGSAWIGPDTYELFREVVSEWDAQS